MRKYLVGIGTILCLIAFFAIGVKTQIAGKADAKPATKIAANVASSAGSGLMIQTGDKNVALATTKSAATAAIAPKMGTKPVAKSNQSAVVLQEYAKLPLSFEPNLGQANGDAKFLARGDGYSLFLTSGEAVLAMKGHATKSAKPAASSNARGVLRMKLEGSNPAPNFSAQDELPGKSNYFIGTHENWHANVPTYGKVEEKNVYAGIDLVTTARSGNWNMTSTLRRERTRRRFRLRLMARAS
jgi:hypothetical protein